MRVCPDCLGSGEVPPHPAELWVSVWRPRCPTCDGTGELIGTALVPYESGVLITHRVLYELYYLGQAYLDGWGAAHDALLASWREGVRAATYADVRDYLDSIGPDLPHEYFCQIALYLTRDQHDGAFWMSFYPVI